MFKPNLPTLLLVTTAALVIALPGTTAFHPLLPKVTAKAEPLCQAPNLNDDDEDERRRNNKEKYLFVWAGDQARINPDFLAVVNLDES